MILKFKFYLIFLLVILNSCNTVTNVTEFLGLTTEEPPEKHCDLKCRQEMLVVWYLLLSNFVAIEFKNSNFGTLEITTGEYTQIVEEGGMSKWYGTFLWEKEKYKITSSKVGTIIDQEKFDLGGNMKDGLFIREDGFLINYLQGCNRLNGESGKVETTSGCEL